MMIKTPMELLLRYRKVALLKNALRRAPPVNSYSVWGA
jgi:hypothetical protein